MRINKFVLVAIVIALLITAHITAQAVKQRNETNNKLRQQLRLQQEQQNRELQDKDNQQIKLKQDYDKQIENLKQDYETKLQAKRAEKARLAALTPRETPVVGRGGSLSGCEAYRPLVSQYAWDTRIAMAIMRAESGCNPMAANLTDSHATCKGSFGLFQIACFDGQVYDPAQNVAIAYRKYKASGWRPWGAYTSGAYLKYL